MSPPPRQYAHCVRYTVRPSRRSMTPDRTARSPAFNSYCADRASPASDVTQITWPSARIPTIAALPGSGAGRTPTKATGAS